MQNDMWTAVIWSKSKPEVKLQYGGRLGEFNGMPSQSHASHCGVLPFGEFNAMISQPHATLQGKRILSAILLKIAIFYFFVFLMQFGLWRAAAFVSSSIHLFVRSLQPRGVTLQNASGYSTY